MRYKYILLLLLSFQWALTVLCAPIPYISHIDSDDGLSENNVKAVMQDHFGFVWFGTKNGLDRYDGITLKHFDVDDMQKREGNHNIAALYEDDDHTIWVGTDRGVYLYNPKTERFTQFDVQTESGETVDNWISQIMGDLDGNVWVIVPTQGAFRYHKETGNLKRFRTCEEDGWSQNHNPQSICLLPDGEVWIGTNGAGLYRYVHGRDELVEHVLDCGAYGSLSGQNIFAMCAHNGWIILGVHEGRLLKYHPRMCRLEEVDAPRVHYKLIRSVLSDGDELFVATHDGLYVVNEEDHSEVQLKESDGTSHGLSDNIIYSLALDREKGLWIGTLKGGVCYMSRRGSNFVSYLATRKPGGLSGKCIRAMQRDGDGMIWIANEEGGLDLFNPSTGDITSIPVTRYKGGSTRLALMVHDGKVWSAVFKNGIDLIDVRTHDIVHYTPDMLDLTDDTSVYSFMRDRRGRLWLGTGTGVYSQSGPMRFSKVTGLPDIYVQDMREDEDGKVWIAAMGMGVFCVNPETLQCVHYGMQRGTEGTLPSDDVTSVTLDHSGNLWFSTDRGGICMFDKTADKFVSYSKADGLPDDVAYKIMEDSAHCLWFGTNHGLVRFRPETKDMTVYRSKNTLISDSYNYMSAAATADGRFIFGGTDGIVVFDPLAIVKGSEGKKVCITNLRVNNQDVKPENGAILDSSILYTQRIRLPYENSNVSMDFSAFNYSGEGSDNYEYMLVGVDEGWNSTQDGHSIVYSKLHPGDYTLRVRSAGDGTQVSELDIHVDNPWFLSWPAFLVYVLLFFLGVYLMWRRMKQRQMRVMDERERSFMAAKEKELLTAKINFFTDITHEIRTPLTLIAGGVENLKELMGRPASGTDEFKTTMDKNLKAVTKNTQRLLNLINQLLDFRKMDSNAITLNCVHLSLSRLMEEIVGQFDPVAGRMNKTISLDLEDNDMHIDADVEALTKILSNLLNNACKYSETFIHIMVCTQDGCLVIRFINDGDKIPADKAEDIFKPFTQLDNTHVLPGSGLGLPMARSFTEMHGGTLTLNTASEYNEFVLTLPLIQEHVIEAVSVSETFVHSEVHDGALVDYDLEPDGGRKEYTVLVVEDNADVMQLVVDSLKEHYNILTAENGSEGLKRVHEQHVDVVVSDVMMPVVDGQEMCRRIKEDIEVSHVPVILLTARQTLENRIEGLKAGADAYIGKPFSIGHLKVQVETLLANRRRERESFAHKPYLPVQNATGNRQEEKFLVRISELIIKNIREPEFNVEQLASEMCMSRSSLHRKIKEISNITPIDFIRIIRLKKAAELIHEHGYRSSEVCEMVGISSPSYFIKLFQKQFGMTPKQFASRK